MTKYMRAVLFMIGFTFMVISLPNLSMSVTAAMRDFSIFVFSLGFFLGVPPVMSWVSQLIDLLQESDADGRI